MPPASISADRVVMLQATEGARGRVAVDESIIRRAGLAERKTAPLWGINWIAVDPIASDVAYIPVLLVVREQSRAATVVELDTHEKEVPRRVRLVGDPSVWRV